MLVTLTFEGWKRWVLTYLSMYKYADVHNQCTSMLLSSPQVLNTFRLLPLLSSYSVLSQTWLPEGL